MIPFFTIELRQTLLSVVRLTYQQWLLWGPFFRNKINIGSIDRRRIKDKINGHIDPHRLFVTWPRLGGDLYWFSVRFLNSNFQWSDMKRFGQTTVLLADTDIKILFCKKDMLWLKYLGVTIPHYLPLKTKLSWCQLCRHLRLSSWQ